QVYLTWGYNRAYYDRSDIHFRGEGYDFTLEQARAEDMWEGWNSKVFLHPRTLTIPQFNFRAGYYFWKNTALSLGWDHMKYHVIATQAMKISGHIDEDYFHNENYNGNFDHETGDFNHEEILYNPDFIDFHHSNGFNFVRAAIEQRIPFLQSPDKKHILAINGAVSLGVLVPWTDFTFFGQRYLNKLHLSGYGVSAGVGVRYEFFKWFFIQGNAQLGWTNLPDIMLQDALPSRASQKITFFERSWAIGGYVPLYKNKKWPQNIAP
ncbi:MAG: hypothetical protein IT223_03760, partial [Crocinitomicaceae bacterium]|nr:hypothetical protein [Crocinitomicaceae bacterium]